MAGRTGRNIMKYIIGDWVEYRDTYARVFESFGDSYYLDSLDIIKFPKEDELTPIPLTTDILEKNEWIYYTHCDQGRIYSKDYKGISIYIGVDEDCGEYMAHAYNGINDDDCAYDYYLRSVKYVHQLQHLLFGLGLDYDIKI